MRKGLLAALALVVANSAAQAQYWPNQPRPNYYPAPQQGAVWVVPPPPTYYSNPAPRATYPTASPNYLPQNYFPGRALQVLPPAPATPVPPEPVRVESAPSAGEVRVQTVSRPSSGSGPLAYFTVLQTAPAAAAQPPAEPVVFHRECHENGFASFDYLLAWIRHGPLGVPLVTTGSVADADPGSLDSAGTAVLFGDRKLDYRMFHGFRLEVGRFFDDDNRYSVDANFFYLFPRHVRFQRGSDDSGLPVLGRPVFNVVQGDEDVFQIATPALDPDFPVIIVGRTAIDARAEIMGGEVNGRWHAYCGRRLHTEVLGGFRTLRLEESLTIRDTAQPLTTDSGLSFNGNPLNAGDIVIDRDGFRTENQFYGLQIGGKARWECERMFLDVVGKLAMGVTDQRARIEGSSTLVSAGLTESAVGGILALPTNIGEHNRQVFGVIPELGVNIGVEVTNNLRFRVGYAALMWNGVTRPGTDQDFASVTGAARPAFHFREEVFFLQSFNFGLEFHY